MINDTYVVIVDPSDPTIDRGRFADALRTFDWVKAWWNHLSSVYLVVTDRDSTEIREALKPVTADTSVLIMPVDVAEADGWLPDSAWRWIRNRSHGKMPSEAVSPASSREH